MGRYYSGDINGKFWFGIQDSDDASFFGGTQCDPAVIDYHFDKADEASIRSGIEACRTSLGTYREKLDAFFAEHEWYVHDEVAKELGDVTKEELKRLFEWYARLELGTKILQCVVENGICDFEAEC